MSANRRIYRPRRAPRVGASPSNRQLIDFQRSDPYQTKHAPHAIQDRQTQYPARRSPKPTPTSATRLHRKQTFSPPPGCPPVATRSLRVFPQSTGIFDRQFKNAHIISTALPTAVGPSLRSSGLASGAGETLAQCKTHHDVFPNQTSPSGTARAGPRYATFRWSSVFYVSRACPMSSPRVLFDCASHAAFARMTKQHRGAPR